MKSFKLLFSASCAILVYITISILCGQDGILAYTQLEAHKIALVQNYSDINQTNTQLLIDTMSLKEDETILASYAKKMGFVHDGEVLMKVSGIAERPAFVYNAGVNELRPELFFVPDYLAKIVGLIVFVGVYGISLLLQVKKRVVSYGSEKVRA